MQPQNAPIGPVVSVLHNLHWHREVWDFEEHPETTESHEAPVPPPSTPLEALHVYPCVVLLGEAGSGKTWSLFDTVPEEYSASPNSLVIECSSLRTRDDLVVLSRRLAANVTFRSVLLDGLSEAGVSVLTQLEEVLAVCLVRKGVLLRMTCRTSDWPSEAITLLKEAFAKHPLPEGAECAVRVVALSPLSFDALEQGVLALGLSPEPLVKEVRHRELDPLISAPRSLKLLLEQVAYTGALPASRNALYLDACLRLCQTASAAQGERQSRSLETDERLAIASRLAALSVFCGKPIIDLGDQDARALRATEFCHRDLPFEPTLRGGLLEVRPWMFDEVLRQTGLFMPVGGSRQFRFKDQSFAESLAAWYLHWHGTAREQLIGLLLHPSGGIVPTLRDAASWLEGEEFRAELIRLDPFSALGGEIRGWSDQDKRRLMMALLEEWQREHGRHFYYRRERWLTLCYPEMAEDLRPWITDSSRGQTVRTKAVDVIFDCSLTLVFPVVTELALDPVEPPPLRVRALKRIAKDGDRLSRLALRPLLNLDQVQDTQDDFKGYALQALWAEGVLSCEELFGALTWPKEPGYFGAFSAFVRRKELAAEVEARLGLPGLERALRWMEDMQRPRSLKLARSALSTYLFEELQKGLSSSIAHNIHHRPLAESVARLLLDNEVSYYLDPLWSHIRSISSRKRVLCEILITLPEWDVKRSLTELRILATWFIVPDDALWLCEWLSEAPQELCSALVLIAWAAFRDGDPASLGVLSDWFERNPERFRPLESFLGTPEAVREKEAFPRQSAWLQGSKNHSPLPANRDILIANAFVAIEAGDCNGWVALIAALERTADGANARDPGFGADIQECPGWQDASSSLREQISQAARRFLEQYEPQLEAFPTTLSYPQGASAGLRAICLLNELGRMDDIPHALWTRWAPVVVSWTGRQQNREVQAELIRLWTIRAPEAVSEWLRRMLKDISTDNLSWFLDQTPWARLVPLDCEVRRAFAAASGPRRVALLEHLLIHQVLEGRNALEYDLANPPSDPKQEPLWIEVALLGLQHAPTWTWPYVIPWLESHPEQGRRLLERWCRGVTLPPERARSVPPDWRLRLFSWLRGHYPPSPEREHGGIFEVTPANELQGLCFQLVQASLETAPWVTVASLREQLRIHPDWNELQQWIPFAEEQARKQTWIPPNPGQVLQLVSSRDRRLIRGEGQLMEVVLRAFDEWSDRHRPDSDGCRALWERVPDGGLRPVPFSMILEGVRRHLEDTLGAWVVNRNLRVVQEGEHQLCVTSPPTEPGVEEPLSAALKLLPCWQLADRFCEVPRQAALRVLWFDSPSWHRVEDLERWGAAHMRRRDDLERQLQSQFPWERSEQQTVTVAGTRARTVSLELRETEQQLCRALPYGQALLRRLEQEGVQRLACSSVGDEHQWHLWIQWPEALREQFGLADRGLMVCLRGTVGQGDLGRARKRLEEAGHSVDVDLQLVVDEAPNLVARLENIGGPWGQRVGWQEVEGEFPSLQAELERCLPRYDIFEQRNLVTGRQLFGRDEDRRDLLRRIRLGESVSMVGLRRVGKTSLARDLARILIGAATSLELGGKRGEGGGAWTVLWQDVQIVRPRTLEALLAKLDGQLPPGANAGSDPTGTDALSRWVLRLEELLKPGNQGVCIFLDEFDLLFQGLDGQGPIPGINAFLHGMKGLAQQYRQLSLVLIGRDPSWLDAGMLEAAPNPTLGWVIHFWVSPLQDREAQEMLTTLGRRLGMTWPSGLQNEALALTGGHPMLLRQFGSVWLEVSRRGLAESDTPMAFLERQVVQGIVEDVEDLLRARFPSAYELLRALGSSPSAGIAEVIQQAGGWYGHAARVLRNFGLIQGTPISPRVPLVFCTV